MLMADSDDDGFEAGIEPAGERLPRPIDHDTLPPARLPAASPSRPARGLAYASILIGGLCGGLIGFAFTDLQCTDGCTGWAGLGAVVGAVVGAVGVAIVAVLVLRAMDEWETVKDRQADQHPGRRSRPS